MSGALAVQWAAQAALVLLIVGMILLVIRLIRGPNLGDRILALDTITLLGVGFIAAIAVLTGFTLYIDIAIAIGLVGSCRRGAGPLPAQIRKQRNNDDRGVLQYFAALLILAGAVFSFLAAVGC